jgi:glycosyltransferase involved in cell wall biosynthesis
MNPIPILQIVGNSEGGGTRLVMAIMDRLESSRFHFTLVAPKSIWLADACARLGAEYKPLPLMKGRFSAALPRDLRAIIGKATPAIAHAHGTRAAWFTLRSLSGVAVPPPLIYSEHLFSMDARQGPFTLPYRLIERYICQRAARITTSRAGNAERIVRAGWTATDRVPLRHYGVAQVAIQAQVARALSRRELGVSDDTPLVGSIGRLVPQKGFSYLLRAMKQVCSRYPGAQCLIVGDGPLRAALEKECRDLGIASHVRFLGAQPAPWTALANCDVIALPSIFEGLPLTLLEALTVGMPVVATQTGGATEVVMHGRNGLLAPIRDAFALAQTLDRLLGDPQLREKFRAAGPPSVADYDLAPVTARIVAMYERLVAEMESTPRIGQYSHGLPLL